MIFDNTGRSSWLSLHKLSGAKGVAMSSIKIVIYFWRVAFCFFAISLLFGAFAAMAFADSGPSNCLTGLTGDVTASGPGSAAATISDRAVTGDKIDLGTISGENLGGSIFINTTGRLTITNYTTLAYDHIVIISSATGGVDRALRIGTDNYGTGYGTPDNIPGGRAVIQADNEANNIGETLYLQPDGSSINFSNGRFLVNVDKSVQWGTQVISLPTCDAAVLGEMVLYHKTNTDSLCACQRSTSTVYKWNPLTAVGDCS